MMNRSPRRLMIGSAVLTAGGVLMIAANKPGGWGVAILFGACLLIFAFDLWRGDLKASPAAASGGQADELVLRSDRLRSFILWIGCSGFAGAGWWLTELNPLIGWLCLVFFGLGVLVIPFTFLPNSASLKLTRGELIVVSPFKQWTTRWADMASFDVMTFGSAGKKFVGIRYASSYRGKKIGEKIAKAITGFDGMLPDTYGLQAEDLASVLNDWRRRATSG